MGLLVYQGKALIVPTALFCRPQAFWLEKPYKINKQRSFIKKKILFKFRLNLCKNKTFLTFGKLSKRATSEARKLDKISLPLTLL